MGRVVGVGVITRSAYPGVGNSEIPYALFDLNGKLRLLHVPDAALFDELGTILGNELVCDRYYEEGHVPIVFITRNVVGSHHRYEVKVEDVPRVKCC